MRRRGWAGRSLALAVPVLALSLTCAPAQARTTPAKRCRAGTIRMFKRGGRHPRLSTAKGARQRAPKNARVVCLAKPRISLRHALAPRSLGSAAAPALGVKLPRALNRKLRSPLARLRRKLERGAAMLRAPAKAAAKGAPPARASGAPPGRAGGEQNLDNTVHSAGGTVGSTGKISFYADTCPDASGVVHGKSAFDLHIRGSAGHLGHLAADTSVSAPFTVQVGDDGKPNHMTMDFKLRQTNHVTDGMGKTTSGGYSRYTASATVSFPLPATANSVTVSGLSDAIEGSGTAAGLQSLIKDELSGMIWGANSAVERAHQQAEERHDCQVYTARFDSQIDMTPSGGSPFSGSFRYGYTAKAQLRASADGSAVTGVGPGSYTATSGSMTAPTAGGNVVWSIGGGTGGQMIVTAFDPSASPTITLSVGGPAEQYTISGPGGGSGLTSPFFAFAFDMLEGVTPSAPLADLPLQPGPAADPWAVGVVAQNAFSHAGALGAPIGAPVPFAGTEHTTITVRATRKG